MKFTLRALVLLLTTYVIFLSLVNCAFADVALKPVGQNAVPLRTKTLSADVVISSGRFASTRLDITFQNLINDRIEADFIYTVPDGAVVTDFAYYYGPERVVARVAEKEQARAIYQHITSRMRDPALVEMIGKNTFRARIFPIMPHADLRVQMRYVQCLPTRAATASYQLPLLSFGDTPLDKIHVSVRLPHLDRSRARLQNSLGLPLVTLLGGDAGYQLDATNFRPNRDVRVSLTPPSSPVTSTTPPGVALIAARAGGSDGFFALALDGKRRVTRPQIRLVSQNDLAVSDLEPYAVPGGYLLLGRYRGTGNASVQVTDTITGKSLPPVTVIFTNKTDADTVASRLWAAARIARLSRTDRSRAQVVALSKRWGLPSKYTSWIAIPKAERERYRREKTEAEMTVLAARLSPYIRAGKSNAPAAKLLISAFYRLAKSIGENPAEALRQRTAGALYDQISYAAAVVAKNLIANRNDTVAQAAHSRLTRLCRDSYSETQALQSALQPHLQVLSDQYAPFVARNDQDAPEARRLWSELTRLNKVLGNSPGWLLGSPLSNIITKQAQIVAEEIVKDADVSPRETAAQKELERICTLTGDDVKGSVQYFVQFGVNTQVSRVTENILSKTKNDASSDADRAQLERLCRYTGQNSNALVRSYLADPIRKIAAAVTKDVIDQSQDTPEAHARYAELTRLVAVSGETVKTYLYPSLSYWIHLQAARVAEDIAAQTETSQEAQANRSELTRLWNSTGTETTTKAIEATIHDALVERYSTIMPQYITFVEEGREKDAGARKIIEQINYLHTRMPAQVANLNQWMGETKLLAARHAFNRMEQWVVAKHGQTSYGYFGWDRKVPEEWSDKRLIRSAPEPVAIQNSLWQKATRLAAFAGEDRNYLREKALMPWASTRVALLRQQFVAARGDRVKQAEVREQFLAAVRDPSYGIYADFELRSYGKNTPQGREAFARDRIARIMADPNTDEIYRLLDKNIRRFDIADHDRRSAMRAQENGRLALRQGDPLVWVYAPQNSRSVIAVLPSGETKSLHWESTKGRWEARFDVPTYAASGAYEIALYITAADGSRSQRVFRYDVDTTAPKATGIVAIVAGNLEITIHAEADTARVVAVVPWGGRCLLEAVPGEPGKFFTRVPLPAGTGDVTTIPVWVTDGAHNRAEITVGRVSTVRVTAP